LSSIAREPLGGPQRRLVVAETWVVMTAFLVPALVGAGIVLARHIAGAPDSSQFPTIISHHLMLNMILGIFDYGATAAIVPVALFLLARSGQPPRMLGLGWPRPYEDVIKGLGLAAAGFGTEILLLIPFSAFLNTHKSLVNHLTIGHIPHYYLIFGIAVSLTTAIVEEVFVNGYLLTRLGQLGWSDRNALFLSLFLRTSYHAYYGVGFLLTIPLGYYVTRSFQKHHRLNRSIAAHFLYDAILFAIVIL
jgi:membrane protease YdiL (CAAX protease family)